MNKLPGTVRETLNNWRPIGAAGNRCKKREMERGTVILEKVKSCKLVFAKQTTKCKIN